MPLCSLFVADLIVGMEELELHYRGRGRYNFRKIKIATISVRMVTKRVSGKKGVSQICSDLFRKQIGTNRSKSDKSREQGTQIRTNQKKIGQSA